MSEDDRIPAPNEIWRHWRGGIYQIITLAQLEWNLKTCVVYVDTSDTKRVWVRPLRGDSGWLTPAKIDHTEVVPRFTFVGM